MAQRDARLIGIQVTLTSRRAYDLPSGNTGREVLARKKARSDIRMIKTRRKGNLTMRRSLTEETLEVPKQILQIGDGRVPWDVEEGEAEAHTSRGNDKEAEVEVLVIAGAEVVVKVQRGRTKLLPVRETEIKREKDTMMSDQADRELMKGKRDTRDLHHASLTTKVKRKERKKKLKRYLIQVVSFTLYTHAHTYIVGYYYNLFADNFKKHGSSKSNRDDRGRRRHDDVDRDHEKDTRSYDPMEILRERTVESERYRDNRYYHLILYLLMFTK